MREDIAGEYPSRATRNALATTYFLSADLARDAEMMCRALKRWEEPLPRRPEYRVYVDNARHMLYKRL